MDEKSLLFGVSYSIDSLIMSLLNQKVDLNLDDDYYVNISPPPIPDADDFGNSVISGLFVDVTEKMVKATLVWLRERENENMDNPKLKLCIDGNLIDLTIHDMQILLDIMKKCSNTKKPK